MNRTKSVLYSEQYRTRANALLLALNAEFLVLPILVAVDGNDVVVSTPDGSDSKDVIRLLRAAAAAIASTS